jgi:hypothetical protein
MKGVSEKNREARKVSQFQAMSAEPQLSSFQKISTVTLVVFGFPWMVYMAYKGIRYPDIAWIAWRDRRVLLGWIYPALLTAVITRLYTVGQYM